MSETRKAIIISTGMDNLGLVAALKENETFVGASANRIKAIYAKLAGEKAAIEAAENDASLARLNAFRAEQEAINKAWMEKQAAMSVIAGGSGGAGSGFVTAEQKAAGLGENAIAGGAAGALAGKGLRAVGHEGGALATIFRETAVLTREGFRGNFTRMLGSFTILLGAIGGLAVAVAVGTAAIVAIPAWKTFKAFKEKNAAEAALNSDFKIKDLAETLRKRVDELEKNKLLSPSNLRVAREDLSKPSADSIMRVLQMTDPFKEQLKSAEQIAEHERSIAQAAKDREESEKIIAEKQKEQERATISISREYRNLRDQGLAIRDQGQKIGQVTPTLEDLAGSSYTRQLNKDYGAGGRFDLGAGDGPFAGIAQDAALAQKQQMWDIIHGNAEFDKTGALIGGEAFRDKQRYIGDVNKLGAAGLETPAMKMDEMKTHLQTIASDISDLLKRAEDAGIVVQIQST